MRLPRILFLNCKMRLPRVLFLNCKLDNAVSNLFYYKIVNYTVRFPTCHILKKQFTIFSSVHVLFLTLQITLCNIWSSIFKFQRMRIHKIENSIIQLPTFSIMKFQISECIFLHVLLKYRLHPR